MSEPQTFYGVNPIFRVADLAVNIPYYTQKLGFKLNWSHPYVVSVTRGRTDLFLAVGDQGHPGAWVWIGVSDVEALHTEYQASGAKIRNPPTNYDWALEMQVEDPDGNILRIGSDTKPGQPTGPWLDMYGHTWTQDPEGNPVRQP